MYVWTDEDVEQAERARRAVGPVSGTVSWADQIRAIMDCALELARARGGTMTAGPLEATLRGLHDELEDSAIRNYVSDIRQHISAQGTTVATLQAKVAETKRKAVEGGRRWQGQVDALRSEVERLKAEVVTQHAHRKQYRDRAQAAESRLAAIREPLERMNKARMAMQDWDAQTAVGAGLQDEGEEAFQAWGEVLQDALELLADAPQGGTVHECDAACTHAGLDEDETRRRDKEGWSAQQEANCRPGDPCLCNALPGRCTAIRHPCSPTCTHDDNVNEGHPERVKAQSVAVTRAALGLPDEADIRRSYGNAAVDSLLRSDMRDEVMAASGGVPTSAKSIAAGYVRLSDTATLFGAREVAPTHPVEIARREGFNEGAEAMRAACWAAIQPKLEALGVDEQSREFFKRAIEGAAP